MGFIVCPLCGNSFEESESCCPACDWGDKDDSYERELEWRLENVPEPDYDFPEDS